MAVKGLEVGDVKRADVLNVFPENIIVDYSENGRKFSPDVMALVKSILEVGRVLQPVGVRKIEGGKLKLFFGYGRHAAVSYINQNKLTAEPMRLPCIVQYVNNEEAFLRNIAENRDRSRTTAVDDAHNIRRLSEQYGKTDEEILAIYGTRQPDGTLKPKSPAWLSQMRKINTLSDEIQEQIHRGELSANVAFALADMPEEARTEVLQLAKEIAEEKKGEGAGITYTEVMVAARRKKAIQKQVGRKLVEVKARLEEWKNSPALPNGAQKFSEYLLGWINDEVEDEAVERAVRRYFKE